MTGLGSCADLALAPLRLLGAVTTRLGELARPARRHGGDDAAQLVVVLERTNELLEQLATVVGPGTPPAATAASATSGTLDDLLATNQDTQILLTSVLTAQQRTNDLLELALRAAFEADDEIRGS